MKVTTPKAKVLNLIDVILSEISEIRELVGRTHFSFTDHKEEISLSPTFRPRLIWQFKQSPWSL